jgi:hypothetical protein
MLCGERDGMAAALVAPKSPPTAMMQELHEHRLQQAPERIHDASGTPRLGTWSGASRDTNLDAVAQARGLGKLQQLLCEKRWQWFGIFTDEVAIGGALVRTGYAAQVFFWACDRRSGEMVCDVSQTLPAPAVRVSDDPYDGEVARLWTPGARFRISRDGDDVTISGDFRGFDLFAKMRSPLGPPITAICPQKKGLVNVTQKQVGFEVSGALRLGERTWQLDGPSAVGMLDYTHGLMAYETSWLWAIGAGRTLSGKQIGFNLISGFNGGLESVVWVDGQPFWVGNTTFRHHPGQPRAPWYVSSEDGLVDLKLKVEATRAETVDYRVIRSCYVQPLGQWSGTVAGEQLGPCPGVAEDHHARW